ncbi:MAG: hypothetical protein GQ540_04015 [Lutibacter sp.]|uniref:hypothetical protein n=1 Tax=Lutibacter sp. TaxID=1925666 RepID=UPI0019FB3708|nr:hypothetical protein [Lutibacter sp.]NOR27680.1 hypothetical protein [Lutibacter sp.]
MHKKIKAELISLAQSILEMKNNDAIDELHKKAHGIYEKLSVLKFVDAYINTPQNNTEIVDKIELVSEEVEDEQTKITEVGKEVELISEEQVEEIFGIEDTLIKDDEKEIFSTQNSLEDELKDAISADVATEMFERVTKENPVVENAPDTKRSLNDALFKNNLQIGLNDRIAFVKHLFEGNQEDFNRVLSQLNSFKTENDAKDFILNFVKPDYDWNEKLEYESRFIDLIERKFS